MSTRSRPLQFRLRMPPNMASPIAVAKSKRSRFAKSRQSGFTWMERVSLMRSVSTGETLADVTWRAGVDALSFGFVKNGGLNAEALILFDPELADEVAVRRKRAGHLQSEGTLSCSAAASDARRQSLARQYAKGQRFGPRPCRCSAASPRLSRRSKRDLSENEPRGGSRLAFYFLMSIGAPAKSRLVTSWDAHESRHREIRRRDRFM